MQIEIDVSFDYAAPAPCVILMQIALAKGYGQTIDHEALELSAHTEARLVPGAGRIGTRQWLSIEEGLRCRYRASVTVQRQVSDLQTLEATPLPDLPEGVETYLMGSRYCPASLPQHVIDDFAEGSQGARIAAFSRWCQENLTYDNEASTAITTALDTLDARRGVCRDYAHLMISFARAIGVPARIVSVYGPDVNPPDFHAVSEVYLQDEWHIVDATGMASADRLAVIGVGRDAADVSFLTAFGAITLKQQSVSVSECIT